MFPADLSQVFLACVEASNDAIMLTDVRGEVRYVNDAWTRIYGYAREEVIGQTPRLLRSGHHDAAFYARMWEEILDPARGAWKGEVINRAKDGRDVAVMLSITPFRENGDPTIRGYFSVASDITDKKAMEMQLLRQDRLVSIGLLASGLAHEIGTPLGVVRGRAEFLLADNALSPQQRRYLEVIVKQADRISEQVHALLHVARLSQSDATVPVRAKVVLEEVAGLLRQNFLDASIVFDNRISEAVRVQAEPSRLEQVFLNLLLNAVHAIGEAQAKGRRENHRITATAQLRERYWEIAIEDTGCGIPPQNLETIFAPFFTTKDVGKGTGLGLSVVLQLVHGWVGAVHAESDGHSRTRFVMRLPAA